MEIRFPCLSYPHSSKGQPFLNALGQQGKECPPPVLGETLQDSCFLNYIVLGKLIVVPASILLFIQATVSDHEPYTNTVLGSRDRMVC